LEEYDYVTSPWLKPLGLAGRLQIGTDKSIKDRIHLSEWVGFMVWTGWWMRRKQLNNARIFMVLLLPTRICCSAICSLGAIIGSIGESQGALTWDQISSLPSETEVFTQLSKKKNQDSKLVQVKGHLGEKIIYAGQNARELKIESRNTRYRDSVFFIFKNNLFKYPLTLTPQRNKFNDIFKYYQIIISDLSISAMLAIHNECLVITNQAGWRRELQGLKISANNQSTGPVICDLDLLIMPSSKEEGAQSGILISSQSPEHIVGENIPLGILDGPESLKNWQMVRTKNIIIMMDQSEYDENSRDILANLTSVRDDRLLPMPEGIPLQTPPGIEMMMFALESEEH
jgi:hypothetical protein